MFSCRAYGSFNLCKHHKEFSKGMVRLLKYGRPMKNLSLLQYVQVGLDHLMASYVHVLFFLCHQNHPIHDGGQLDCSDSHISLSFRNWCPQTVTKTVTCQVQNGTTLQRVYQTCRWPQGCNGGR